MCSEQPWLSSPRLALPQALLHCPKLQQLRLSNCPALETLMIWSDELKELDLTGGGTAEGQVARWPGGLLALM